mgnify:CR=1 FL=1
MIKKLSIILLCGLSGCATKPVIMYPTLPVSITSPCHETQANLQTNEDLLYYAYDIKNDLRECSEKQKALVKAIEPDVSPEMKPHS